MRRSTLFATLPLGIAMIVALTACSGQHFLILSAKESDIPVCTDLSPRQVEDLDTDDRATCDITGADLLFPDGTTLTLDGAAGAYQSFGTTGSSDYYSWTDVGVYGYVAAQVSPHCDSRKYWGSREGVDRVRRAFGRDWACGHNQGDEPIRSATPRR